MKARSLAANRMRQTEAPMNALARMPGQVETAPKSSSVVEGWTVREYRVVDSTNLVAAELPAWEAVRADTPNRRSRTIPAQMGF